MRLKGCGGVWMGNPSLFQGIAAFYMEEDWRSLTVGGQFGRRSWLQKFTKDQKLICLKLALKKSYEL